MKQKRQSWHQIIQDLFDEHLHLLSGKQVLDKQREKSKNVHFDYFVMTGEQVLEAVEASPVLPLSHLRRYNIIEFKSIHESLTERAFRGYVGRALVLEDAEPEENRIRQVGLTLITVRKPVKLLANNEYAWQELEPWKYRYTWAGLEVHMIVLSQLRNIKGGLGLALLQALETDERHQLEVWRMIIGQDLPMREVVQRIMKKIGKEDLMGSIAEDWIQEGIERGREEGLEEGIEKGIEKGREEGIEKGREEGKALKVKELLMRYLNERPSLKAKYQKMVDQASTETALDDLFFSIIGKEQGAT